ncbi:craniofacial development protein 2-like [Amphiura filiformis]|uniref:craniofacial development protein 2-like n=1 Tax=Amphiura filiformis TaxID=82378 RepID=UPI003B223546
MTGQREPGTPSQTVGPDMSRLPTFKPLVVSTYNVRKLHQQGNTHQLFTDCSDAGVDIVDVQEHRLITSSLTDELWSDDKNWVLIYSSATDQRQGGVGLLMSRHIHRCLQSVQTIKQRILTASFNGNPQLTVTIIYAPTESATSGEKDSFYNLLEDHLEKVKRHNIHLVIGDFNARIGQDSHVSHPAVVGPHCFYDTTNDNGERLVNLCQEFKLRPSQSRFPQPKSRIWTWMHPTGSKHQLDHILVNSKFQVLQCDDNNQSPISERYEIIEKAVQEVAEKVVGKCSPCGMPSWVTDKTLKLRSERDAAKKTYLLVRNRHAREVLNTQSYRADELASIHRQMEDLQVANENGNYNTTCKIIHDISGKKNRSNPKVKKRNGTIPSSDKELLAEWKDYFCALLNNDNGPPTSDLLPPANQDLPICADPPTLEETRKAIQAMKTNKAAGLDCAITAEALQGGGETMVKGTNNIP